MPVRFRSPWCSVFTDEEILQYKCAQDLRYYYGTGPRTVLEQEMMLPLLTALVQRFVDGSNARHKNANGTAFALPPLIADFTNGDQTNKLAAAISVFDSQALLPSTYIPRNRIFKASNFVSMRGTIAFECLSCRKGPSCALSSVMRYILFPAANQVLVNPALWHPIKAP